MLPDQPPTFRQPSEADQPFWWRLSDGSGTQVTVSDEFAGQRFASQSDAESWVGEFWAELAEEGVSSVTLLEADREVYGPMSLEA